MLGFKAAENGDGLILHVYEPRGGRGDFSFDIPKAWVNSGAVNLLEEPAGNANGLSPFEVKSWKLTKA